ncbi:E3 ubiquitin-protein ligase MIB2-like isoform X2 [Haemaphysalis longicornis]
MTELPVELLRQLRDERSDADSGNCKYCLEVSANTYFTPCGHYLSCEDCSQRMKRCLSCGEFISERVRAGIPAHLGQRVVRGPDWKWQNEDGGDGHVGTVVAIEPSLDDNDTFSRCVRVIWDVGHAGNYRASRNGPCDLRLYDSGPAGIAFPTVTCVPCRKIGIIGTRWKCSVCDNYNLCHSCYMNDEHCLDHAFLRFDAPGAEGAKVPPRQGSAKVEVRGIFVGAKVARGEDWRWRNQDGGAGKVGTVEDIGDWDKTTVRSQARVRWSEGRAHNYRLGLHGAVDLKCTEPAPGGSFYKYHLPLIAPVDLIRTEVGKSGFRMGELVSVKLEPKEFERLQQDHGGWHYGMKQYINQVGTVQNDTPKGDVRVKFGEAIKLTINPVALTRVSRQGDPMDDDKPIRSTLQHACFVGDEDSVKRLASEGADLEEEDENGDKPIHFAAYGNKPEILSLLISLKADVNAQNKRKRTALHIAADKNFINCIRVLTESAPLLDVNIQDEGGCTAIQEAVVKKREAAIEMLVNVCGANFTIKNNDDFNVLHTAAFQGSNFAVEQILSKRPEIMNMQKSDGFAALHIAAVNGYHDVVETLLNQSNCIVDLETTDNQTPLMLAVQQGYCDVVELLVQKGADINKADCKGNTAMHLSLLMRSELKPERVKASTSPAVAEVMHNLRESCEPGADISLALACFFASRGADLHRMNEAGESALTIAETAAEGALLRMWNTKRPAASQQRVATSTRRIFKEITGNMSSTRNSFVVGPAEGEASEDSGTQRAITGTHEGGQELNPLAASSATPAACDGVASSSPRNGPQGTPRSAQSTMVAECYENRLRMQMAYERQQHELQVKLQERQLEQEDTKRRRLDEEHEMKMAILKQELKYWEKKNSGIL